MNFLKLLRIQSCIHLLCHTVLGRLHVKSLQMLQNVRKWHLFQSQKSFLIQLTSDERS